MPRDYTMGEFARQDDYTTPLAADDINDFKAWKQQYAPNDSGYDYDLPGAYKAGFTPDPKTGHFDDRFKKPNHPTFSTFSQYAKDRPDLAGTWQGDTYIPPDETQMAQQAREAAALKQRQNYATATARPVGSNRLTAVAGAIGSTPYALGDLAARPGQTMAPNPYPPGSEEAQFYEDQRRSNTYRVAPQAALDLVTGGMGAAPAGALGMAGGKMITPGALAAVDEYRPPFYSAVEQAVQGAKQNAAPGQQWAGFLRNQPGVKPEEVETLGLGKLFEQPGSVPKEAVLGEIAANRVNVGEVVKGGNEYELLDRLSQQHYGKDFAWIPVDQQRQMRSLAQTEHGQTKFSAYTLPGGENYREMLLTLPKKPVEIGPAPELLTELPKGPDWDNSYRVIRYRGDGPEREWGVIPPGQAHARAMAGQHPTEAEAVRQALNHINAQNAQQYNQALHDANKSGQFTSSHFDEPNVLAHVRYNDRVIDGKKTLFVEEVQSDWHQKGKREGYTTPPDQDAIKAANNRVAQLRSAIDQKFYEMRKDNPNLTMHQASLNSPEIDALSRQFVEADNARHALERKPQLGVPDAPFKTAWPELAMKRIIREAAEKGYDKVAWTPGSVQAARYPEQLRQHVDNISWSMPSAGGPHPDGLRYVHAKPRAGGMDLVFTVDKDGRITEASASQAKGQHVEDIFGKDMSRQIMEKADGEIASKDFVIGAKGMEGFYDEILPATVNRLVKKHGGRVTQGEMGGVPSDKFDILHTGSRWQLIDRATGNRISGAPPFTSGAEADAWVAKNARQPVHTLDITPSLRAQAMKGFPLFTAGGVAATGVISDLARQDEYR